MGDFFQFRPDASKKRFDLTVLSFGFFLFSFDFFFFVVIVAGHGHIFHILADNYRTAWRLRIKLLGFLMKSMSFAKTAVFIDFQPIRCGFLVFTADIIPSFAFGTGQSNCDAHAWHLLNDIQPQTC